MHVLGVDLGTTNIKAALFDFSEETPRLVALRSVPALLDVPAPGRAEIDPDKTVEAARHAIEAVLRETGATPHATAWSGAMHSLLPLDARDRPLGPAISWADQRSSEQAEHLRASGQATEIAHGTGTPVHAMTPLCKLLWIQAHAPDLLRRTHRFTGLKEYVISRIAGIPCNFMDRSMASATGLYSIASRTWDRALLQRLHLTPEQLPDIVEPTVAVAPGVFPGGGDGPLANLGCGALADGLAALTIGTSGAVRICTPQPRPDPQGRTFCYYLASDLWIRGGAISNGGILIDWACEAFGFRDVDALLAAAGEVPAGADGITMLGYLAGERSPHWDARASASIHGLRLHHTRAHLARAAVESTAYAIRDVLGAMPDVEIRSAAATGGFTRAPVWLQIMADVTGMPLHVSRVHEAAALGAAMLAARGHDLTRAARAVAAEVEQTYAPDRAHRDVYAAAFEHYRALYRPSR